MRKLAVTLVLAGVVLCACGSDNYRVGETYDTGVPGVTGVSVYVKEPLEDKDYERITREVWKDRSDGVSVTFRCESAQTKVVARTSIPDGILSYTGRKFATTC